MQPREDDEDYEPRSPEEIAKKWAALILSSELTKEVIGFLRGEALLAFEQPRDKTITTKNDLTRVFSHVLAHGFPATATAHTTFLQAETHQRCAEGALLTVLSAIAGAIPRNAVDDGHLIKPHWPTGKAINRAFHGHDLSVAARDCIQRLWRADAPAIRLGLARLDLSLSWLERIYLGGANLNGADLSRANLNGAKCNRLHTDSARLHFADLRETVDLSQEQINSAKGSKVDTKLPDHLTAPTHWDP